MAKMRVAQVPRPNGPFELVERDILEPARPGANQGAGPRYLSQRAKLMGGK